MFLEFLSCISIIDPFIILSHSHIRLYDQQLKWHPPFAHSYPLKAELELHSLFIWSWTRPCWYYKHWPALHIIQTKCIPSKMSFLLLMDINHLDMTTSWHFSCRIEDAWQHQRVASSFFETELIVYNHLFITGAWSSPNLLLNQNVLFKFLSLLKFGQPDSVHLWRYLCGKYLKTFKFIVKHSNY